MDNKNKVNDGEKINKIEEKMKTIREKNLIELEKRYPELVKKIINLTNNQKYAVSINSDNETFNLFITEKNIYYYDPKNPFESIQEYIDSFDFKNTRLALFLGFGLGYELMYFIQTVANKQHTVSIVIVEKDVEMFATAICTTDITSLIKDRRINFFVGLEFDELAIRFRRFFNCIQYLACVNTMKYVYYKMSLYLNKDYYMKVLKIFKETVAIKVNFFGNSPLDSLIGEQHMFANLKEILTNPGINMLYNKFKNKPAVIVASGPSLMKNVHLLKEIQDKALIICAESTFRVLMKLGIKPHIVATLERTMNTKKSLDGFTKEEVKDIYLAACPVIPKEAYEVYKGPRIVVYRKFDHFKWLQIDKGMLGIKASSANMAFKIADALGCNPIILIGQDLAYERDTNKTHVEYVDSGNYQKRYIDMKKIKVQGNDGKSIFTNGVWYTFLKGYEIDLQEYKGTCINCTEGGAYIKGTIVIPFKDAIDKYIAETINPLYIIKNNLESFELSVNKDCEKLKRIIKDSKKDLNKILDYCDKGIELCTEYEKNRVSQISKEILEYKKKIQIFSTTFQLLLMHIVQSFYLKHEIDSNMIYSKHEQYEIAKAEITVHQKEWFEFVKDVTKKVIDELIKGEEEIKMLGGLDIVEK